MIPLQSLLNTTLTDCILVVDNAKSPVDPVSVRKRGYGKRTAFEQSGSEPVILRDQSSSVSAQKCDYSFRGRNHLLFRSKPVNDLGLRSEFSPQLSRRKSHKSMRPSRSSPWNRTHVKPTIGLSMPADQATEALVCIKMRRSVQCRKKKLSLSDNIHTMTFPQRKRSTEKTEHNKCSSPSSPSP